MEARFVGDVAADGGGGRGDLDLERDNGNGNGKEGRSLLLVGSHPDDPGVVLGDHALAGDNMLADEVAPVVVDPVLEARGFISGREGVMAV